MGTWHVSVPCEGSGPPSRSEGPKPCLMLSFFQRSRDLPVLGPRAARPTTPHWAVFILAILYYSQSGDDSPGRFSQIWLKAKHERKNKNILLYFWLNIREPLIEIWNFFSYFIRFIGIENVKKHIILAFLVFSIAFWLYITSIKKLPLGTIYIVLRCLWPREAPLRSGVGLHSE